MLVAIFDRCSRRAHCDIGGLGAAVGPPPATCADLGPPPPPPPKAKGRQHIGELCITASCSHMREGRNCQCCAVHCTDQMCSVHYAKAGACFSHARTGCLHLAALSCAFGSCALHCPYRDRCPRHCEDAMVAHAKKFASKAKNRTPGLRSQAKRLAKSGASSSNA